MSEEWINQVDLKEVYHFPPKGDGIWPLFVGLNKSTHREDIYRSAFNLKDSGKSIRNDLAPCLLRLRKTLKKEQDRVTKAPYNFQTKLRDTPFRVWLEIQKPKRNKWETWEGDD